MMMARRRRRSQLAAAAALRRRLTNRPPTPPGAMRCVSLLPSATELVALIAEHAEPDAIQIVGRSHECDFPPGLESLPALTSSRIAWTNSEDVDKQACGGGGRAACGGGARGRTAPHPEQPRPMPAPGGAGPRPTRDPALALTPSSMSLLLLAASCCCLNPMKQVREELEAGNSLYSVDRALLASLLADAVITQARGPLPPPCRGAWGGHRRALAGSACQCCGAACMPCMPILGVDPLASHCPSLPAAVAVQGVLRRLLRRPVHRRRPRPRAAGR